MPGGKVKFDPSRGAAVEAIVAAPPERAGGVGGWQASERALRRPAKWFRGLPDDTISWELIIDADVPAGATPVEERIARFRAMGQPGEDDEPPTIALSGDVWGPDANLEWVMDGMTLGDRLYFSDGSLRRQHIAIQLSRYTEVSEIEAVRVTKTRKGARRRTQTITVRAGDTLRAIALRELGSGNRWKDLVAWNKAKLTRVSPDSRLRTGTRLVVK